MGIHYRNHQRVQRLTNLDIHLSAQCQHHGRDLLSDLHLLLQLLVDLRLIAYREVCEVYALHLLTASHRDQIQEELIGIEGCDRCHQLSHCLQAGVQRLVSRELILRHATAPETTTVQAHIPVTQVVVHEIGDRTTRTGRLIVLQIAIHILDQAVEQREDPAVDLRALLPGHIRL